MNDQGLRSGYTGELVWISPTTIAVNRSVAVTQPQPYQQECNCALCHKKHSGSDIRSADFLPIENSA